MNNSFRITDDRFSAERTDLYDLVFEVQFSRIRFIVRSGDQLLWLEDHFLGYSNDIGACIAHYTRLLEEHPFLSVRFWKSVKLVSDFQIHTLIPADAFEPSKAATYLMLAYPTARADDFEVSSEPVLNQYLVTGTLRQINRLFIERYPRLSIVSGLVAGLKYFSRLSPDQTLGVISDSFIDLYYQNGKSQTLVAVKSPIRNLEKIRAQTSALVLSGEVTPFSTAFEILKEKFKTVIISPGTPSAGQSERFQDIPEHRYFTLLNS